MHTHTIRCDQLDDLIDAAIEQGKTWQRLDTADKSIQLAENDYEEAKEHFALTLGRALHGGVDEDDDGEGVVLALVPKPEKPN